MNIKSINLALNAPISSVVKKNLCTGCGTCEGVCPQSAITMVVTDSVYLPSIDNSKCRGDKGCNVCFKACPGHSIDIEKISKDVFAKLENDFYLGRFLECYTGHSADHDIRYHAASGGLVTQLLIFMLNEKIIDGALVTRFNKDSPLEPESIIATTKEEIIQAQSSKYCPVSLNKLIKDLKNLTGKFAVVGLPCHIHGFRKAEEIFPFLKDRVVLYLGIFCSSTKSFTATKYLLKKYKINEKDVSSFAYRDEGWLGNMVIKLKNGNQKRVPYRNYYHSLRSFFIPYRCTLCVDHTAELADISFGDIYIPEYWNDQIGTSCIIVRGSKGDNILMSAKIDGKLFVETINKALIIKSQCNMLERKKLYIAERSILAKVMDMSIPSYGSKIPNVSVLSRLKSFISSLILYAEIAIGHKRFLWPLIQPIDLIARMIKCVK